MQRARLVILAGAVFYSAWIIAPLMGSRLDPLRSYVSEVGAAGQPHAVFFRCTDLLAGTCFVVAAALWWRAAGRPSLPGRIALCGVLLMGAATMCDAALPLSCTPTADPACQARELAGQVPFTHVAHAFSSGLAGTGGAIAVLGWLAWLRRRRPDGAALPAVVTGFVFLIATVWTVAAMAPSSLGFEAPELYLGLAQRLQIASITLWLVLMAVTRLPPPRRPAPS
ncbi:DUF998 domain-containing protein [Tsukamurella sp. 1534]|uniref:DUF998 domain-containing protein n=1 Tax=Tsukamurella sp. 1534 TaxID=1151061 RepID=UPI0002F72069|nr:DUF998 domain-containing protein [Tsukamurella sp. 1534]